MSKTISSEAAVPSAASDAFVVEALPDSSQPTPQVGNYLLQVNRRVHFTRAALAGVIAGIFAVLFQMTLEMVEVGRIEALSYLHGFPSWGWLMLPVGAAILAACSGFVVERFAPAASGSGIPHIRGVLARRRTLDWRSILPVKFIGGILGLGAGLSLGREGPTVQMGAAIGAGISDVLKLDSRSKRNLIASAAGAGLGAAFNAPLSGFIFVIEELQRELSPLTFVSALISSVTAVSVSRFFTGQLPSFHIHNYPLPPLTALPLFAVMGLVAGYAGHFFNRSLIESVKATKKIKLTMWQKCAIAGFVTGLAGWWLPDALGGGHRIAESIIRGTFIGQNVVTFFLVLLVGKYVLTLIGYASGAPGGVFAPLLVFGAIIGTLFGDLSQLIFPNAGATPAAYAVVAMGAMFTSVVRAPLTGIVLVLEMTGNQEQLFSLILTCVIAYLVTEHTKTKGIYDALLEIDLEEDGEESEDKELHLFLVTVGSHSVMDGPRIKELTLPDNAVLISVRRGADELVAKPELELMVGDHVLVAGSHSVEEEIQRLANPH